MKTKELIILLILSLIPLGANPQSSNTAHNKELSQRIQNTLGRYPKMFMHYKDMTVSKVQLIKANLSEDSKHLELHLNKNVTYITIRERLLEEWEEMVLDTLSRYMRRNFDSLEVNFLYNDIPLENFVPNIFRKKIDHDTKRNGRAYRGVPLLSQEHTSQYNKGLLNAHIALWPSHGWYFEAHQDSICWQFQRPALFQTIEDLHTFQYVERYLAPMIENAGGVVISPRERSTQRREIVIDNSDAKIISGKWSVKEGGYNHIKKLNNQNPHIAGSYLLTESGGEIEYSTKITKADRYGVTLCYKSLPKSSKSVRVDVEHSGGKTTLLLNQQMGGSMWIYLGEWEFDTTATVRISGEGIISADAVRFGGGMGTVERGGSTSGMPRWSEAARYYLQFSGVPNQIYEIGEKEAKEQPKEKNQKRDSLDYIDDYKSRGMWANWLIEERNIPLDLAIAVHSNAGIVDTTFGTLTIHYTDAGKGKLRDGASKFTSRELSDMVQSQIVRNIRARHFDTWTNRSLFDRQYAEVSRPIIPSLIIEMFSHQNKNDMELALTPQFRFQMARSIYIGVVKYLAQRYNRSYVIQPLPLASFDMSLSDSGVKLLWTPTTDSLERTATADYYRIYQREGLNGEFMPIATTNNCYYDIEIAQDSIIRSYRVTAVNYGGESFVSETLSCGFTSELDFIDVVQNECKVFDKDTPYIHDYSYVGEVYDNDPKSEFIDNRNPGWGASYSNFQGVGRSGETLDNTLSRGVEIIESGGSYISRGSGYNHWAPIKMAL